MLNGGLCEQWSVTEFTSSAGDWRRGDPGVGEWKPEEKVICMNERFLRQ